MRTTSLTKMPREWLSPSPELTTYINDLYGQDIQETESQEFIKLMTGKNRKGFFYRLEAITDPDKLGAILTSRRFGTDNFYMSMSSYRSMSNARAENISRVYALGVDVDYRAITGQEELEPSTMIKYLNLIYEPFGGVPKPTYIEHGHNLRMIYILEEPFNLNIKSSRKRQDCMEFLKRIEQVICDRLNNIQKNPFYYSLPQFNAEPHKLTSFFRVPYSLNTKYEGGYYDTSRKVYVVGEANRWTVDIMKVGDTWDINKLARVLPPKFNNYDEWKKQKLKKEATKVERISDHRELSARRLTDLSTLQAKGWDIGHRERMCYFFWLFSMQSGRSWNEALEDTLKFNCGFKIPLREHTVKTECKPSPYYDRKFQIWRDGWERRFTDKYLQIELQCEGEGVFTGMNNAEKCRRYYMRKTAQRALAGQTKEQDINQKVQAVKLYRDFGMSWQEVADALGVGIATAKRYGKRLKETEELEQSR